MKKSATITLTLVTAVTLATACSSDTKPRRKLAGYRNPRDTTQVSSSPRAGYVPYYVYMGGRSGRGGSYGSRSSAGAAARGGFGSTGAGHASASS